MKILLINPYVEQMHDELAYAENFRPPLGLAYCASVLEQQGHEVVIVDALVQRMSFARLQRILKREQPGLVGIGIYSPCRYEGFRTARAVKEALGPHVPVVVGGPHPSALPEDTLEHVPHIDYCIAGEGEHALARLVSMLEQGGDVLEVPGLFARRDGGIVHGPPQPNIADLDTLPKPARHLLPMAEYGTRMPSTMHACTTVLTSRGCPARCTFCTRDWFSRETRFHSAAYMADEIESVIERWGVRGFIMQDDTFTLNKRRIHEFCAEVRKRRLDITWLATTRVDCVSPELLRDMHDAGCRVVTFGVESMNPETLKWLKKGFTVERAVASIEMARAAGLVVRCSYLIGIGNETEEDVRHSVSEARKLPVSKLKANVGLSVYPGTPLYQMAMDAGILPSDYSYARGWEDPEKRYGNNETPRWYTPHVSYERLLQLRRETEVNILFTKPTPWVVAHRARRFARRLRKHPMQAAAHALQLGRALVTGNSLRVVSPTDH
jgi:anaerobic magnesium-protoporphyrin IX monomethyl ester cyclase